MLMFIIALVCIALSFIGLTLRKTFYYLPEKELKRQAKHGDSLAKALYQAVAYGAALQLLLWLLIGIFAAAGFVLFARVAPPIFGFIAIALLLWFGFAWMPSSRLTSFGARVAVWSTPTLVWLLRYLNPVFSRMVDWVHARRPVQTHSGLYERADLLEFIDRQKQQPDSRIPLEELELAERALRFDQYKLRHIVVPRKQVKAIGKDDAVGPILLDELHATGHSRFPVYDKSPNDIIGTLHLITLEEAKQGGHVRDYIEKGVAYLHENDTLADALHAVYTTKHQLFVVVNSFEEYVGIVTLEDILHSLLGHPVEDEFDAHHDKKAVAAKHTKKAPAKPAEEPTEEKVSQTEETVVE